MTLLRLMDEPEQMTEAQLQELLADDEVRTTYELMADCKKVYQREKLHTVTSLNHKRDTRRMGRIYRIAAILAGSILLSGIALAAIHILSNTTEKEGDLKKPSPTVIIADQLPVRFADICLDSILTVVSAHYGKTVHFINEEPRAMKLITTWNPADSLTAFIDHLNMFDYLHLSLENDTIFVEGTNEEDEQ